MLSLRVFVSAAAALSAAACSANLDVFKTKAPEIVDVEVPVTVEGPPAAWQKDAIVGYVRGAFRDPYSIRDAEISSSAVQADGASPARTIVCVQLNARNGFGGYVGRRIVQFDLGGRSVRSASEAHPQCTEMHGKGAVYQPFPELEALSRL